VIKRLIRRWLKKKKVKKEESSVASRSGKNTAGKIIFWILVLIGFFFLLAFWGSGWSFWTIIGLLMWAVFLRWTWVHITSGFLALGKIFFLGAVVIVLSLIFTTPAEDGMGVNLEIEKNQKNSNDQKKDSSSEKNTKEIDTITKFLKELEEETDLDFSKIKDDEVTWTAERINLKLQKGKSFKAKDLSLKDFDKIQEYFLDLGADTGGVGFTFVPPAETVSAGFVLKGKEYSGMMCVLMGSDENDDVWIGCGWGPTDNSNSK
jgi:hypothetical protein